MTGEDDRRPDQYVLVSEPQWAKYQRSKGAMRKLMHARIFYGRPFVDPGRVREVGLQGFVCVLHPTLEGRIPPGLAITESQYRDETRHAHRSQRSIDRTQSTLRRMALA